MMSRLAAMSRRRAAASWAMRNSTRAWLARKLQLVIIIIGHYFWKPVASFQLRM